MSLHPEAGGPGPMMYRPRRKEPPMSELEKALEWWDSDMSDAYTGDKLESIVDAARRLLNLTSPETVEKACHGKWGIWWKTMSEEAKHTERQDMKRSLEAVLRSVEEDET